MNLYKKEVEIFMDFAHCVVECVFINFFAFIVCIFMHFYYFQKSRHVMFQALCTRQVNLSGQFLKQTSHFCASSVTHRST